ncbi:hypothetical protein GCM10011506_13200 [Marivirga lumbricoides]|uniref:TonB C-terminal domain-containing protein n=1 Tax=Marivirga lumbricoides TaxID=1046115 RepID=A0ABQ1LS55_9BACT|nr:hypothetical protein GCM10011506_13200 [Marivirga lumbricoides]
MKCIVFLLLLSTVFEFTSYSQEIDSVTFYYEFADIPAEPIGGREAIYEWIGANMNYELIKSADTINCESLKDGRVFIFYIITVQGDIIQPEIIKGLGDPYDSEALRLISEMPIKWTVAIKDGEKVPMRNVTVIRFCSDGKNAGVRDIVKSKKTRKLKGKNN